MTERWSTPDEVRRARERMEAAIPGWTAPAAFGVGVSIWDDVDFPVVNVGTHRLAAVVLATVCGHASGSASYPLELADLDQAIELLTPAEACEEFDHPNLISWRRIRALLVADPRTRAVAAFCGDLDEPISDPSLLRLRAAMP
ncbi:hypothetical protein [Actinoalloteichus spitiensis]|uniref:hypothetical protein n=1 Tax=Actinoalloteichus spitiensis TaxID=252394 RepID=UPI000475044B|nr:hypothetical protein [Actinoalloteichus spitiensis]